MKSMESMLQQSKEPDSPDREDEASPEQDFSPHEIEYGMLATIIHRGPYKPAHDFKPTVALDFPTKDEATRLAQGYFASYNHTFPIFSCKRFMQRLQVAEYPPNKKADYGWFATVLVVLTFAHRLRAMSAPARAEKENYNACPYLRELLEAAPKLTYAEPKLDHAQVLLGIACILRGTAIPDIVPMLTATAIRILQCCDVHQEEVPGSPEYAHRHERMNTFWVSYIMDKDIALQFRKPSILHEQDIGRTFLCYEPPQGGTVLSLDSFFEVNLFSAAASLAVIQDNVWQLIYRASGIQDRKSLEVAQELLNPRLANWKQQLPFQFRKEDLVGRWPKHAIVNIVTLHFRYFHTLVELNKTPPLESGQPLNSDCALAEGLPQRPHSTAVVAVEAARDALDLAALLPSGNFQNVWYVADVKSLGA